MEGSGVLANMPSGRRPAAPRSVDARPECPGRFRAREVRQGPAQGPGRHGANHPEVETVDAHLGTFKGRITRDNWIEQAAFLAKGDTAGFEARFGKLDG